MSKEALRCAIYTRVSSDQGLEQDFNSLDAQRDAAEAYIKSQAHEGWKLIRTHYDDGGFSGGSMERPALQALLAAIRERKIDVIVVYKVDRLTRSLADFAKLVELFDLHKVSFVSVTQSFNTTTSMGRLTLNVLLSFAQFEREVTGERIRDKIAASKKKGMWMGGTVPLGYRVEDRKLLIDETEAATVRCIFETFLKAGSLSRMQAILRDQGITTRRRVLSNGRIIGGIPLTNGPLHCLLTNRTYLGELNHKGASYPGDHAPTIPAELFAAVQAKLADARNGRIAHRSRSGAPLKGKIFDDRGNRMSPSHAIKGGIRYRYYVSAAMLQGRKAESGSVPRVSAAEIEALVERALTERIKVSHVSMPEGAALVENVLDRVIIRRGAIELIWRDHESDESPSSLRIPWTPQAKIRKREIIAPADAARKSQPIRNDERLRLMRSVAEARQWIDDLIEGLVSDTAALAIREGRSERSIRMTLSLAFLDPRLIKAAAEGRLPRGYGCSRLTDLPIAFGDQWRALGLPIPSQA